MAADKPRPLLQNSLFYRWISTLPEKPFFRFEFLKIYIHYLCRHRCENRTPFADHAPFANYFLHETISTPSFCKWCKRELRWITRISLSLFLFQTHFFPKKNSFPRIHLTQVSSKLWCSKSVSIKSNAFTFRIWTLIFLTACSLSHT